MGWLRNTAERPTGATHCSSDGSYRPRNRSRNQTSSVVARPHPVCHSGCSAVKVRRVVCIMLHVVRAGPRPLSRTLTVCEPRVQLRCPLLRHFLPSMLHRLVVLKGYVFREVERVLREI